jgi:hypothetical protein
VIYSIGRAKCAFTPKVSTQVSRIWRAGDQRRCGMRKEDGWSLRGRLLVDGEAGEVWTVPLGDCCGEVPRSVGIGVRARAEALWSYSRGNGVGFGSSSPRNQ